MNSRMGVCPSAARRCKSQIVGDGWKGPYESRTTLHWELTSMKSSGITVQRGEYHISRLSDGNRNGHVRERMPPRLDEGNMPQYSIRCNQSVRINSWATRWGCTEDPTCTWRNDDARIHEPEMTPSGNHIDTKKCEPDETKQGKVIRRVMTE